MRKKFYRTGEKISMFFALIIVISGLVVLVSAPPQASDNDQTLLEEELQQNAEFLAEQSAQNQQSLPPTTSENTSVASSQKEIIFTAIGDSVMLGAAQEVKKQFPNCIIDAEESRQVWEIPALVQELDGKGLLYDTVVVALGANGSFSKSTAQELLNTIGSQRRIYWVSPYGKNLYWTKSSFDILNELEAENENLIVLNWPELAKQNENWFISDGMHLNEDGQTGYANFLFESLTSNLKNNE